ncbi:MAG: glycoside hydrolase family 2 TIM barrel-domain containing protein [Bacteroidia bacterium]|nr:glycoside hydrolase family 2 TIM barrel-domain containing protein [Bacteroidia bacterium]
MIRLLLLPMLAWAALLPLAAQVPLPEHPRPDHWRAAWVNLNGPWQFEADPSDAGLQAGWMRGRRTFSRRIQVPFSWAAPLSGIQDTCAIAWYARELRIPASWTGGRIVLVIGASDWRTDAWLDGKPLGRHEGGYTPFEFDLTDLARPGAAHQLVIRADDADRGFKLEGKQGYGNARGIWQTPYLELRGNVYIKTLHFSPDVERQQLRVQAQFSAPAPARAELALHIPQRGLIHHHALAAGASSADFILPFPDARLWSLDDPHLYEVQAVLSGTGRPDTLNSYFGMRSISAVDLPGTSHRYVALNGEPVYLQLALDQSYHPEGFYTFPSDEFMRDEILRARQIGLNGIRTHVKADLPRKLYWADRLGILVMADVPNSWGEPDAQMRKETEYAMRQMMARDFNHPSIFAWIVFNETWGLFTRQPDAQGKPQQIYLPETQQWVASMYRLAKSLDPTRLVEDNSVCCGIGHTETDLNTWHSYLPGWEWRRTLDEISGQTRPGSAWNFEAGYRQQRQPNLNSEFGNVWGYEGSTGDVDWTWDYHRALNEFRRHPAVAGWLYTEHHDVINEWNGYWRFDRSEKITGLEELFPGMSLRDLHAPFYLSTGQELCRTVQAGETADVPLSVSWMSGRTDLGDSLWLEAEWGGWNSLGQAESYGTSRRALPYQPWLHADLPPLTLRMPDHPALGLLKLRVVTAAGTVLHRNFCAFEIAGPAPEQIVLPGGGTAQAVRFSPASCIRSQWSLKQWNVLDSLKVNGAGHGFFEYEVSLPPALRQADLKGAVLIFEASAKQLLGKDREGAAGMGGDYMRGQGTFDPGRNPNAYPMTDGDRFPSAVTVTFGGLPAGRYELPDDPADHRGILSWHAQPQDRKLREAGSYGYRIEAQVPAAALQAAQAQGMLRIRLAVDEALPGGLALYGSRFGRYPMNPVLLFLRD